MDPKKLMELIKNKKQALKSRAKTIKPNPGSNRYVLLPGWRAGEEHVMYHDFGQHYIKNSSNELQAVYPCAEKIYGNPCPVCEGLSRAIKMAGDDDTVNLLKEAVSKQSYLLNVLALDSDDDATPQILEIGTLAFKQILDLFDEWGAAILDPEAPQVIVINRDGKGVNTKYSVQVSPKKHTLPKGVLSKLNNLDDYVKQESEEQQRRALNAINNVAGLLPAATPSADKPRTAASAIDKSDDDLRDLENARAAQAAKSRPANDIALDDELDDLLGDLTGTDD